MQQSQRAHWNHALEYAVLRANALKLPVLVCFGFSDGYLEANLRHYRFMLEGLQHTHMVLSKRGIPLVLQKGSPDDVALRLAEDAAVLVCDRGYLRIQKRWRQSVASEAACEVVQVESDVVVPVVESSDKAEYAARTLRPKIHRQLPEYFVGIRPRRLKRRMKESPFGSIRIDNLETVLKKLNIDRSVLPVSWYLRGGTDEAKKRLRGFLRRKLQRYELNRNQPQLDDVSYLSPYFHFGQISPLYVALMVRAHAGSDENADKFLEELIVRRELACNFVHFRPHYDTYECVPEWARKNLEKHRVDPRLVTYTSMQLESASTHDRYWNAAMNEMKWTGYMHNTMRMYWGKKIIEWTLNPRRAYEVALYLNNKYFLDGRDPSSFMNVAWLFGLHDRPWSPRPVFGTVRSMTTGGLERKADMELYLAKIAALQKRSNSQN